MEFRNRAGHHRWPRCPASSARFGHSSRGGYSSRAQGARAGPPPFESEVDEQAARRERIIRLEVERRLIDEELRRELALARPGLHGGFAPDPFLPPPPPPPPPPMLMPMGMHHPPPPPQHEEFGPWEGFGPRRHAVLGQRMLRGAESRRSPPPPPQPKQMSELREIPKVLSSETKVSGVKRKAAAIAAATGPRRPQKPSQDWSCALCQVSATNEAGLNLHLEGKKHRAKLAQWGVSKAIEDDKHSLKEATGNKDDTSLKEATGNKDDTGPIDAPRKIISIQVNGAMHEVVQKTNFLWCERCRVRCDTNVAMAAHLRGKKHRPLNKVWTSIMAVRTNMKNKEESAASC